MLVSLPSQKIRPHCITTAQLLRDSAHCMFGSVSPLHNICVTYISQSLTLSLRFSPTSTAAADEQTGETGEELMFGHVAIQRIQGQRQQTVKDVLPLHQVPSGGVPAIEGIGPSCGRISNSDHNNHGRVQSTSAHVARSNNFPFLSLHAFLCCVPFRAKIHTNQLRTLSHQNHLQQY